MNNLDRKAKLEKALAYDDTLQDISAHPEAFRQGRAAEMVRLSPLHAALVSAVETLDRISFLGRIPMRYSDDIKAYGVFRFRLNEEARIALEALAKIDKALGDVK